MYRIIVFMAAIALLIMAALAAPADRNDPPPIILPTIAPPTVPTKGPTPTDFVPPIKEPKPSDPVVPLPTADPPPPVKNPPDRPGKNHWSVWLAVV